MRRVLIVPFFVAGFVLAGGSAGAQTFIDWDCEQFPFQEDAQSFFLRAGGPGSDPHNLDADGDGIACESLPSRGGGVSAGGPRTPRTPRAPRVSEDGSSDVTPTAGQPRGGSLPKTGGPANALGIGGASLLLGGLLLLLSIRRSKREPSEPPLIGW